MTDTPRPADLDVRHVQPGGLRRLSFVWLVPVLALLVSLGLAYQNYADRGTLIEIAFNEANGVKAGETLVKYRDVEVGKVEKVSFSEGLGEVLVSVRIDKEIAPYLDDDAQFWVVQPDVSLRGVTGLETVLSGVFIEGNWDSTADVQQFAFYGLDTPPLTRASQRGTEIVFRARDGSALANGAPVLHKGIQVGYLEAPQLAPDGTSVIVNAFIEAPYDQRLTTATRFWDSSGFSVSIGTGGVSLNVSSLAALIEGGIAFDTVISGGLPVQDGHVFDIFESETAAQNSLFAQPTGEVLNVAVLFDGSVSGLTKGSEVRFKGVRVGQVEDLSAIVVDDRDVARVQLRAILALEPARLGLGADATVDRALTFLSDYVLTGLRARLVTGNILSGSLVIELVELPDAPTAVMNREAEPYPHIPTAESKITDVADSAEDVLERIEALPIEELLQSAIDLMNGIERLTADDAVRQAPAALTALLDDTRALVTSDNVTAIPQDLRQTITQLNAIIAQVGAENLVGRVGVAVDQINGAVAGFSDATATLPTLLGEIETLAVKANALDLEGLVAEAKQSLARIDALLLDPATQSLPATVDAALTDLRSFVTSDDITAIPGDLRLAISNANGLIAQATAQELVGKIGNVLKSAERAAASIETASADLPQITAQLNALTEKANALEIDQLVAEATATLNSIDTLIGSDQTQDLPRSVSAALDEVRLFLAEVRDGGAIDNVNAALASANQAAQAIEEAAQGLPALSARATALVRETEQVIEGYGTRSRFNAETLQTLRDIQAAADAVSALARTIQRNPSSLLTGR